VKVGTCTIKTTRSLWSLILGLGLALGLLWALMARPAVEAQTVKPGFTVDLVYDALWGMVDPGDVVTLTRNTDGAYGAAEADGVGFFWTPLWQSNGQPAGVGGDDAIKIYVNGALAVTLSPMTITGQVDVLNDQVTGNVSGVTAGASVTVTLGHLGSMLADEPKVAATVDGSGNFTADFSGVADIAPHMMARIAYRDANGNTVQDYAYPSEVFQVRDWAAVEGYAAPGQTITVTVVRNGSLLTPIAIATNRPHGDYAVNTQIELDDVVEVDLGGDAVISVTVEYLELRPDATTDQIAGTAPAGASVRGYVWDDVEGAYNDDTTVADGSGNYTLDLGMDLETRHWPYVAYADAEGDEVGYSAPPPHIRAYPASNNVRAVADGPNQPVTYTLDTGAEITTVYGECGRTNSCAPADFNAMGAGHVITVELPNRTMVMTVADFTLNPDAANDEVYGDIDIPGRVEVSAYQWHSEQYPIHGTAAGSAAVGPPSYAAPFPDFDIRDGMDLIWGAHYAAGNGHRTLAMRWQQELAYFQVKLPWDVEGVPPSADESVTATLYTAGGVKLASTSDDDDGDPWRFRLGFPGNQRIEPSHWVTVTSESGWEAGLQVPALSVRADADTDLIWGTGPKSLLFVAQEGTGRFVPVDDYILDQAFFGGDIQWRDYVYAIYQAPNGNRVRRQVVWPQMRVIYDRDEVAGNYPAGHTFSITLTDSVGTVKATAVATSEIGGGQFMEDGFSVWGPKWSPQNPDLEPGDWVHFQSDDGYDTEVRIGSIRAYLDIENDAVRGLIYAPWFTQTLQGMVRNFHWWGMGGLDFGAEPDGGSFSVDIAPHDIISDTRLTLQYAEPDNDWVIRDFDAYEPSALNFDLGVNYGHDWVNGHCEAGHTIWITATEGDGVTTMATATITTDAEEFHVDNEDWLPSQPDIEPGDWVYAQADNGEIRTVHVGTITGHPNAANDSIHGTVEVEWFEDVVEVWCMGWSGAPDDAPRKVDLVLPDGTDTYVCSWDPDTEWDLQPDQVIGVWYHEADGDSVLGGDSVFNAFRVEQRQVFLPLVMRDF
jgi:hypothetical protein